MAALVATPSDLASLVNQPLRSDLELLIDQALVDRFVTLTGDDQWIHADPVRAADELAGGRTLVPGGLIVALIPQFLARTYTVGALGKCLIAEYRQVRFLQPVPTGTTITLVARFASVRSTRRFVRANIRCGIRAADDTPLAEASVIELFYPPSGNGAGRGDLT